MVSDRAYRRVAAIFGGRIRILALILIGGEDDADQSHAPLVERFVKTEMSHIPGASPITDASDEIDNRRSTCCLGTGPLAMSTMLFNLWLAGRITLASGRLKRPWPDLVKFHDAGGRHVHVLGGAGAIVRRRHARTCRWCFAAPLPWPSARRPSLAHTLTRGSPWQGSFSRRSTRALSSSRRHRLAARARRACRNDFSLPHPAPPPVHQPPSCNLILESKRSYTCKYSNSAHRPPRPDGRHRQRQERLCP